MCVGRSLDPVHLFPSVMGVQGDCSVGIFVAGDCVFSLADVSIALCRRTREIPKLCPCRDPAKLAFFWIKVNPVNTSSHSARFL